jgi:6-phosphogluconate dehydrogenase (decarboxylating)
MCGRNAERVKMSPEDKATAVAALRRLIAEVEEDKVRYLTVTLNASTVTQQVMGSSFAAFAAPGHISLTGSYSEYDVNNDVSEEDIALLDKVGQFE